MKTFSSEKKKVVPRCTGERGLSLIELIVVTAVIALLVSISLVAFNNYRDRASDLRRVAEMTSIQKALELYYITYNKYPDGDFDGCGSWDTGNAMHPLLDGRSMEPYFGGSKAPVDIWKYSDCEGYRYYRYPAGSYGCPASRGPYYVLGVTDMQSSDFPYPGSPGWACGSRDWQNEFDWVVGGYEN